VYTLPLASRTARGKAIVNLLELAEGEKVAAILPVSNEMAQGEEKTILMVLRSGRVKKTSIQEFSRPMKRGKRALTINDGDEIIAAHILSGNDTILLISSKGISIRFHESDIRAMGRMAAGVNGINLAEDDFVVGAIVLSTDTSILTVTENGYGKRSPVDEYRVQRRGGKGIIAIKASERNGAVIGAMQVDDEREVILIADSGKMIRMPLENLRVIGRTTQGVRLINLEEGEKVVAMDIVARDDSEEAGDDGFNEESLSDEASNQ
jgi:DNA gyrase subunit A